MMTLHTLLASSIRMSLTIFEYSGSEHQQLFQDSKTPYAVNVIDMRADSILQQWTEVKTSICRQLE